MEKLASEHLAGFTVEYSDLYKLLLMNEECFKMHNSVCEKYLTFAMYLTTGTII